MSAVAGHPREVITVLHQPEEGTPEVHRPVAGVQAAGTTKLPRRWDRARHNAFWQLLGFLFCRHIRCMM